MPRMSKKRKQEWALFLNVRNRITYNGLCRKCIMTASRVSVVSWCIAPNIYQKGERRKMKQMENEMIVSVPLEVVKASEIEPREVKWLWYPYIHSARLRCCRAIPAMEKAS